MSELERLRAGIAEFRAHAVDRGQRRSMHTGEFTPAEVIAHLDAVLAVGDGHEACARRVENGTVHFACGVSVPVGDYEGGVYAEHVRRRALAVGDGTPAEPTSAFPCTLCRKSGPPHAPGCLHNLPPSTGAADETPDLYAPEREALQAAVAQYEHLAGTDYSSYLLGAARALLALRAVIERGVVPSEDPATGRTP